MPVQQETLTTPTNSADTELRLTVRAFRNLRHDTNPFSALYRGTDDYHPGDLLAEIATTSCAAGSDPIQVYEQVVASLNDGSADDRGYSSFQRGDVISIGRRYFTHDAEGRIRVVDEPRQYVITRVLPDLP